MNRKALKKIGIDGKMARQVLARGPQNAAQATAIADEIRAAAARSTAKPLGQREHLCGDCGLVWDDLRDGCPDCDE